MFSRAVAVVLVVALGACGGGGAAPVLTPSLAEVAVVAGAGPVALSVTASGAGGTVTWSLSGPGSIDPLTGPSTTYTPPAELDAPAVATITATLGALEARTAVSVDPPPPVLADVSPVEGHVGTSLTLTGARFGAPQGRVTLGGVDLQVSSWSSTEVVAVVPAGAGAASGPVALVQPWGTTGGLPFTVTATVAGVIADGSPSSALLGNWAGAPGGSARFRVRVAGTGRAVQTSGWGGSGWSGFPQAFTLEVPVGEAVLEVDALDAQGGDTLDLLQASSRAHPVAVGEEGVAGLALPVLSHWDVHPLDPGFDVRDRERQVVFRDALHGVATFKVDAGVDPAVPDRIHGAAMRTEDGGATWTLLAADISPDQGDFRPTGGSWFGGGFLWSSADGQVLLSIDDAGKLTRSADGGASWAAGSLGWLTVGPGGPTTTRFAPAGGTLYASISTGGVQGSRERSDLVASTDLGAAFGRIYDTCAGGCATPAVPMGFAGGDLACADLDPARCISLGTEHDASTSLVLTTADGFDTFSTFAPACGYFTGLQQVVWVPGTLTAHVLAGSSCPGTPVQARTTHDGGETWGEWRPSPFPARTAFADAEVGFSWWDSGVWLTRDGGATWRFTGHPPGAGAALRSVQVLDRDHAWVLGHPGSGAVATVARWIP